MGDSLDCVPATVFEENSAIVISPSGSGQTMWCLCSRTSGLRRRLSPVGKSNGAAVNSWRPSSEGGGGAGNGSESRAANFIHRVLSFNERRQARGITVVHRAGRIWLGAGRQTQRPNRVTAKAKAKDLTSGISREGC